MHRAFVGPFQENHIRAKSLQRNPKEKLAQKNATKKKLAKKLAKKKLAQKQWKKQWKKLAKKNAMKEINGHPFPKLFHKTWKTRTEKWHLVKLYWDQYNNVVCEAWRRVA